MSGTCRKWIYFSGLAFLVALIPLGVQGGYYLLVLNIIAINGLVVLGLNLLIGFAGQISLGHAAFFGMGAYLSAILTATYNAPPWPTLVLVMVFTAAVAYGLGIPTLRLEGHYLVMATLGFNIIVYILMVQMEFWTGGPSGFSGIPPLRLGHFAIQNDLHFYWLIWSFFLATFMLSLNLADSRIGRALRAIHENELIANSMGVNTERYKVLIFAISAAYASLAGSFYAHYLGSVNPETFNLFKTVHVYIYAILGGIQFPLLGPIVGSLVMVFFPEFIRMTQELESIITGGLLLLLIIFLPTGILSLPGLRTFASNPAEIFSKIGKVVLSQRARERSMDK